MFTNMAFHEEKIKKYAVVFGVVILLIIAAYKLSYYLAPFLLSVLIAAIIEPINKLHISKFKITRKRASAINVILFIIIIFIGALVVGGMLAEGVRNGIRQLPSLFHDINQYVSNIHIKNEILLQAVNTLRTNISSFNGQLFNYFYNIINKTIVTVQLFPSMMIFIFTTVLSTYFISSSKEQIISFVSEKIPEKSLETIRKIKNGVFKSLLKLIKGYALILTITFSELFIGLSIIGVKHSFVLALIISLIDLLPVLGTGIVLIPWVIVEFAAGSTKIGSGIFLLYITIIVVRQVIEPKIISNQIGVHPLLTLIGMYVTFKFIGAGGLILGPIGVILIASIYKVLYAPKKIET